jgi:hypothetical protein
LDNTIGKLPFERRLRHRRNVIDNDIGSLSPKADGAAGEKKWRILTVDFDISGKLCSGLFLHWKTTYLVHDKIVDSREVFGLKYCPP